MSTAFDVYEGFWHNHSFGNFWGWTWTLNNSHSNILISVLAIFIGLVGGCFWNIVAFVLYQLVVKPNPGDGIRYQVQLILRNSASPWTSASQFFKVAWHWRRITQGRAVRLLLPLLCILPPLIVGIGFIVIALESTRTSGGDTSANEVLLKSHKCGSFLFATSSGVKPGSSASVNITGLADFGEYSVGLANAAKQYSSGCYHDAQFSNNVACQTYSVDKISYTTQYNQPCPFGNLCLPGAETVLKDTGLMDSHVDLGINAVSSDRLLFRKVSSCDVLNTSGHTFNTTIDDMEVMLLQLGAVAYEPFSSSYTYANSKTLNATQNLNSYQLTSLQYNPGSPDNTWQPIKPLNKTDADVGAYILAPNSVVYSAQVLDPWFLTTDTPITIGSQSGLYQPLDKFRVLGCTDQYQICRPDNQKCTGLTSIFGLVVEYTELSLSPAQVQTAELLLNVSAVTSFHSNAFNLGSNSLLATARAYDGLLSDGLPPNQWQVEVDNLFTMALAGLQAGVVQFASKSYKQMPGEILQLPSSNQTEYLCNNQKARNIGQFQSFTAAAIFLILGIGLFIIMSSILIDPCYGLVMNRTRLKDSPRYLNWLQWVVDSNFQQQRLAFSAAGHGNWLGPYDSIPVTDKLELLPVAEVDDSNMIVYRVITDTK